MSEVLLYMSRVVLKWGVRGIIIWERARTHTRTPGRTSHSPHWHPMVELVKA